MGVLEREIQERDERNPGFSAEVDAELATIRAFDDYVNAILDELAERGMTRAELASAADMKAANLRRLLTAPEANPTFATLLKVTNALGLDIKVVRRGDLASAG